MKVEHLIIGLLLLIILDQGCAMRRLVGYNKEQSFIIDDYYGKLRHCDDVFEAAKNCTDPEECLKGVHW